MDWDTRNTSSVLRACLDYTVMGLDVPTDLLEALPDGVADAMQQETPHEHGSTAGQGKRARG